MMNEVLLYGLGFYYHKVIDNIIQMVNSFQLHICGVSDIDERSYIKGGRYICPKCIDVKSVDYVIVMATDEIEDAIRSMLIQMGFERRQIISSCVCEMLLYDWGRIKKFYDEEIVYEVPHKEDGDVYNFYSLPEINVNDITFFSMNCAGGCLYHSLRMRFFSPMINLFIKADDFIKLLKKPKLYMDATPVFCRFDYVKGGKVEEYPVYALNDIYLHMNHTRDINEGIRKWEERKQRIIWDNIAIITYAYNYEMLKFIDELPYEKKICFVPFKSNLPSAFSIDMRQVKEHALWDVVNRICLKEYPYYYSKILERLV